MSFWDSSALVPLLRAEPSSASLVEVLALSRPITVWWATELECVSAVARDERDGLLGPVEAQEALDRIDRLKEDWVEIEPTALVRETARRLLRTHPLRAADALQLAAAYAAADRRPATLGFVSLDERQVDAARREGFPIVEVA